MDYKRGKNIGLRGRVNLCLWSGWPWVCQSTFLGLSPSSTKWNRDSPSSLPARTFDFGRYGWAEMSIWTPREILCWYHVQSMGKRIKVSLPGCFLLMEKWPFLRTLPKTTVPFLSHLSCLIFLHILLPCVWGNLTLFWLFLLICLFLPKAKSVRWSLF